jgi:hypothetical protein
MSELSALAGSEGYGACDDERKGAGPCTERSDERRRDIRMSPPPASQSAHTGQPKLPRI